ncbi:UreD-domain-containing protein [Meredithblackwellia eburnea MCA 4105]
MEAQSGRLLPGEGVIQLGKLGSQASFSDLQFSYPLKLIVPARHFFDSIGCAYVLSYGGGLVAGDRVKLSVEVTQGSGLVLLTQGSTKVFKTRPGRYLTESAQPDDATKRSATRQLMEVVIHPDSTLFLLPSPVTCFSKASYSQRQSFKLSSSSSLILLDWYTSGRMSHGVGEEWQFARYRSQNEVWVDGRRIARDVMLLEDESDGKGPQTSYYERVEPYSCYASIIFFGPAVAPILSYLQAAFSNITQYKQSRPYSLLWSFSELEKGKGGIARCAADTTESVKEWIVQVLQNGGIEDLIGKDLWRNAFS